jgi:hypothetical protein
MTKHLLNEGLEYKSLKGMVKPTLHIDEFSSKMGNDDDISVISFYVTDDRAATDLVSWFEKGYDFILDADKSPGEISPNKYLVYVELKRRTSLPDNVETLLDDLTTLTEWSPENWQCVYGKEKYPFSVEAFKKYVPLSPKVYRSMKDGELNKMRSIAGIKEKSLGEHAQDVRDFVNLSTKF